MRTNVVNFGIKRFVYLSARHDIRCELCDFKTRGLFITKAIDHYVQQHKYVLVHVAEKALEDRGDLFQPRFAILGK